MKRVAFTLHVLRGILIAAAAAMTFTRVVVGLFSSDDIIAVVLGVVLLSFAILTIEKRHRR